MTTRSESLHLPAPSLAEQERSAALSARIGAEIDRRGGFLPFDDFMRMALYEPDLGYYNTTSEKFGPAGDFTTAIRGVAYDSRQVEPGFLFAALEGEKRDGHDFLEQARDRGAAAVLSSRPPDARFAGLAWVQVEYDRKALALVARNYYGRPDERLTMIGPNTRPTAPVPFRCAANNAISIVSVNGTTNCCRPGLATATPSTALNTEMAGVRTPSPKNSAAPSIPAAAIGCHNLQLRVALPSNALSANTPPSPRLSTRSMRTTYLIEMTKISDQKMSDSTPRTFACVSVTPPGEVKHCRSA